MRYQVTEAVNVKASCNSIEKMKFGYNIVSLVAHFWIHLPVDFLLSNSLNYCII